MAATMMADRGREDVKNQARSPWCGEACQKTRSFVSNGAFDEADTKRLQDLNGDVTASACGPV